MSEVEIFFTPEALLKAKEIKNDYKRYKDLYLRVYIEGKGCDGFTYGVSFDDPQKDDLHFSLDNVPCLIDPKSYLFCKGSTITWVDDDRGSGFLVVNPNQRKYRGKFYKKSAWQEVLADNS